jgi:hypothetical protein
MDVTFVVQRIDMPPLDIWQPSWGTPVCGVICITADGQPVLGDGGNMYIPIWITDLLDPPTLPEVGTEITVSLPMIEPRAAQ